jgi:hypothetical protein
MNGDSNWNDRWGGGNGSLDPDLGLRRHNRARCQALPEGWLPFIIV